MMGEEEENIRGSLCFGRCRRKEIEIIAFADRFIFNGGVDHRKGIF